ncbi:hypothetical protein SAMN05443249_3272 [Beijerinckia sp. 28-YEA-48]|nr:hypothetical protein SAMN05443249_3272 [Beijerinckia sp. 28-YEA-48]
MAIFDQGYTQACCSALLMNPSVSDTNLVRALLSLPQADVLVRVEAPIDVLEGRLRERMNRLDPVGRLLEISMGIHAANITDHVAAIDRLSGLLTDAGRPIHVTSSDDAVSQEACVAAISEVWDGRKASWHRRELAHHDGQER